MRPMKPIFVSAALIAGSRLAFAQPAPPAEPAPPTTTAAETPALVTAPAPDEHEDDKPAVSATYDGGVKLETDDGKFEIKLGFRNQFRFEADRSLDDETPTKHNQFQNSFQIPRSRLGVEGFFFGEDNRFKVEVGLGDLGSFGFLKDMFLEKKVAAGPVWVRAGQWKRPFNRAEMVSDFASTFNERSIENELAGGGRSIGVALHDDYDKSPEGIAWVAGIFNTFNGGSDRPALATTCVQNPMTLAITCVNSRPTTVPADFGPTLVARVDYNSAKSKGFSESDLEGGPLRYSVGGAYKVDLANFAKATESSWSHAMSHGLELDANIKAMGYSVTGGVVMMRAKNPATDPAQGPFADYGFYVQPAYFVVPKHGEVALRFAMVTVTTPATAMMAETTRKELEARAAVNIYWHGHAWKLANDIGFLKFTGTDAMGNSDKPDLQIRMMLQAVL